MISECIKHDTNGVHLFIDKLIKFLKEKLDKLNKIYYFTDGCAAQYKNKKIFANVVKHEEDFGMPCEWHFHATAHGKGPCDGIGGTVKRMAARYSLANENSLTTAHELYEWASTNIDMNFVYVSNHEHEKQSFMLKNRFEKAIQIKGTRGYHAFIPVNNNELIVKTFSKHDTFLKVKILP